MATAKVSRMRAWLFLVAAGLAACALPKSADSDAGVTSDGGTSGTQATGAGCGQDPQTGATLCQAVSLCPSLVVDQDLYPGCGFRVHGTLLDLECACDGYLCPVGVAITCAQAQQLLEAQSGAAVCAQVDEGRCTRGSGSTGGGDASSTGNGCDHECQSQCAGDPGCYRACGC